MSTLYGLEYAECEDEMQLGCLCHCREHIMVFSIIESDDGAELAVEYLLRPDPFWKRIRNAARYVLGYASRFGDFDETLFDAERALKLRGFLDKYLKRNEELCSKSASR